MDEYSFLEGISYLLLREDILGCKGPQMCWAILRLANVIEVNASSNGSFVRGLIIYWKRFFHMEMMVTIGS